MSTQLINIWTRRALLPLGLALGLVQAGCAQPVMVQPSVVISSQIGRAPVYAQLGMPAPMVVMPPPGVMYAPPPVVYGPPMYRPAPAWGWGYGHHWGHERGEGRYGHGGREYGWR